MRLRLRDDFEFYAERNLKILPKVGGAVVPFRLNRAQRYIHELIEKQRRETGKVRALILKGRQQGCSTYIDGRFYWRTTHTFGLNALIFSHALDTSQKLFSMITRFHENCNPLVKPETRAASAHDLAFRELGGGLSVATAGSKETGRGSTIQLLHGSEYGFWANPDMHKAGVVQAVSDEPGTEIILESTANGIGNAFHADWQLAVAGKGEFIAIFVPWFWQDEYRAKLPDGWQIDPDDVPYKAAYGLDDEQIRWMELKRLTLGAAWIFKQEYPATPAEAFQTGGDVGLIWPQDVLRARVPKDDLMDYGPRVGGCDPSQGIDRTSFAFRQGRRVHKIVSYGGKKADGTKSEKHSLMYVAGLCVNHITEWRLDKLFIDVVGVGAGVYDRLCEMGYGETVVAVAASGQPLNKARYFNKRMEMWGEMALWLEEAVCEIPNIDSLHGDLVGPGAKPNSSGAMVLEKKIDMAKRGLPSPDEGDALALTFAFPVASNFQEQASERFSTADADYDMFGA